MARFLAWSFALVGLLALPATGWAGEADLREVSVSMWPFCRDTPAGESWSFALTQGDQVLAHSIGWKVEKRLQADDEKAKVTKSFGRAPKADLRGEFVLRVEGKGLPENKVRTNWLIQVTDAEGRVYRAKELTGDSAERRFKLESVK